MKKKKVSPQRSVLAVNLCLASTEWYLQEASATLICEQQALL